MPPTTLQKWLTSYFRGRSMMGVTKDGDTNSSHNEKPALVQHIMLGRLNGELIANIKQGARNPCPSLEQP